MHITQLEFVARFIALVTKGQGIPKRQIDRQVLLISVLLRLDQSRNYSEKELNEEIQKWISQFGESLRLDHATLRRFLVDENFVTRDAAGKVYAVSERGRSSSFDDSLRTLDLNELVLLNQKARDEKRKAHHSD